MADEEFMHLHRDARALAALSHVPSLSVPIIGCPSGNWLTKHRGPPVLSWPKRPLYRQRNIIRPGRKLGGVKA